MGTEEKIIKMADIKKEEKSDFPAWAYDMAKESAMGTDDFFIFMQEWHDTQRRLTTPLIIRKQCKR